MRLVLGACFVLGVSIACGSETSHPKAASSSGGSGGTSAGRGGSAGEGPARGGSVTTGGAVQGGGGAFAEGGTPDHPEGGEMGGEAGGGAAGNSGSSTATGGSKPMFPCPSDSEMNEPALGSVCAPGSDFIFGTPLAVDAGNAARLVAVTPDELTIAWATFGSSSELYFIADRENVDEPFDAPTPVLTGGSLVGLSPDGLRAIVVASDGHAYAEMSRTGRHLDFGLADEGAFATVNTRASADSLSYADAVVAADDRVLVYTAFSSEGEASLLISTRKDDGPWPTGEVVKGCEFAAHGSVIRRPTGIAADGLTLFYFDPDRGFARAAWRSSTDEPFSFFRDLKDVGRVAPSAACDKLYYSGSVGQTPLYTAKNGH